MEEAIELSPLSTAKLDLVCAYLKRVYFFVYYRGHQCRDEGDMIASRSACRGSEAASKEQVAKVSKSYLGECLDTGVLQEHVEGMMVIANSLHRRRVIPLLVRDYCREGQLGVPSPRHATMCDFVHRY